MAKALAGAPGRRHGTGSPRLRARPGEGDVERVEEALEAFCRQQGASLVDRVLRMDAADIVLDADADWLDGPRWTDELCDDLFDAMSGLAPRVARMAAGGVGGDPEGLDEDDVLAEVRRLSRFQASDIVRSASERVVSDLGDLDELTPKGAIEATTRRLIASRVGRNGRSITSAAANGATVTGARQSGVTAQKVWITGQNARPTHAAMNGQRADIDRRFSNGARWPGDPSLPPHESCGCNCHVEIVRPKEKSTFDRAEEGLRRRLSTLDGCDRGRYIDAWEGIKNYDVPKSKIFRYTLTEPNKAEAFRRALGIEPGNGQVLWFTIYAESEAREFRYVDTSQYGKRYYFDFKMTGPNHKRASVRATWIQGPDDDKKRLTSVYVIRKGRGEDDEV